MPRLPHLDLNPLALINLALLWAPLFNKNKNESRQSFFWLVVSAHHTGEGLVEQMMSLQHMEEFVDIMGNTGNQRVKKNQRSDITFKDPLSVTFLDQLYFISERIHSIPEHCHQLGNTHKT